MGKTMLAKALARSLDCSLLAPPVHARPAPVRRHGRQRLQPALERVRVPAGPDLREPPARRRDQPRLAEDAGRAARVHAGEPGHDRRRHATRSTAPFMVMATQNPIEYEGTYPLPEAQLDRFTMRLDDRLSAARPRRRGCCPSRRRDPPLDSLEPVTNATGITGRDRRGDAQVFVEPSLNRYVVASLAADARATSGSTSARARVRGSRSCASSKARALADGRDYVRAGRRARRSRRPCSRTG